MKIISPRRLVRAALATTALIVLSSACSDDAVSNPDSTQVDARADSVAPVDLAADGARADLAVDLATDGAPTDLAADITSDAGVDGAVELGIDVSTDAPVDGQAADGSVDGASNVDGGPDAAVTLLPRLIVTSESKVFIWNRADAITSARAADVVLDLPHPHATTAVHEPSSDRIFVYISDSVNGGMLIYNNASTFNAAKSPDETVPLSALGAQTVAFQMEVIGTDLWTHGIGGVVRVPNASTISASSSSVARFSVPFMRGAAYSAAGDLLFALHSPGTGSPVVFTAASTRTGVVNQSNFTLASDQGPQDVKVANNRLYVAYDNAAGYVRIWNNASALSSAKAADVAMTAASGLDKTHFLEVRHNTLVAVVANGASQYVNVYANAAQISGDLAASGTVSHASINNSLSLARIGANNRLYVLDDDSVSIFSDVTSAPSFVAELSPTAGLADVALVE